MNAPRTAPGPRVHDLANGVKLVCDPAPRFETLAVSVVAGRGARFEEEARNGWSHLLEHMVFKGAGSRSATQIVETIEREGGQINAATGYERTSFQVRALKGHLPLALEVTADLVLRPRLDADDLRREKQVIGQEIAEAADAPDDQIFELGQAAAFAGQALGRPVLGSEASIAGATPQTLEAWRSTLYASDRLVVSVAGAVDEESFLVHAERLFGDAPASVGPKASEARFTGGLGAERRRLQQAHVFLALPGPGVTDPDHFALRLFADILGGGMSSRLFQEARERLGLAYAIDAYAEAYADAGMLGVYAGCAAGDAGRLVEVAAGQISALANKVEAPELARAKAQLKASLFMSQESLLARAEQAAAQLLIFGRLLPLSEIAQRVDAVGPADVEELSGRILSSKLCAAAVLGPKAALDAPERFRQALFG
jgi:predicted Zn-dependent peptidase